MKLSYWTIVYALLFAACDNASNKAVVETIGDIEYVHNPATPIYPKRTASFVEELTIGAPKEEGEIILYKPGRFIVDTNENIYIHDRSDQAIKVFDKNGTYVRSIGAKGSGPEEFLKIGHMAFLPDGRLLVLDWGNRRTSLLSKEGEYFQSCQWSAPRLWIYLTTDSSYTTNETIFGKNRELHVKTLDFSCNELISYGQFTPIELNFKFQGNITYTGSIPYSPKSIFAGDQKRHWLYHCLNNNYLIEVYDRDGNLFRKINRPYEYLPFTSKDTEAFFSQAEQNPNKIFAQMAREVELPKVKTVAERLLVDEQGNLWVETNEKKEESEIIFTAYDLFNKDGFYIAKVWCSVRPSLFVKGKMYSMVVDEETGFRSVKRYRVVWNK